MRADGTAADQVLTRALLDHTGAHDTRAVEPYYLAKCGYAENVIGCVLEADVERAVEALAERGAIRWAGRVAAKRLLLPYFAVKVLSPTTALPAETIRVRYDRPAKPTVDARGRTIPAACIGDWSDPSWSWPVDAACVQAANPVPPDQPRDGGTGQPPVAQYIIKRPG